MLKKVRPDLLLREPRDWDFICTPLQFDEWCEGASAYKAFDKEYEKSPGRWVIFHDGKIHEFELTAPGNTAEELYYFVDYWDGIVGFDNPYWVDVLYALKMSHRYLKNSPHFLKTMRQIQKMRAAGATIPSDLQGWFKRREKETYSYPHPKLNQKSSKFFDPNQGIKYVHNHDTIHLAMARDPLTPAYTKFKDDLAEVRVSKKKFFDLPDRVKLDAVMEESYVLALERSQIPFPGVLTPRQSFLKALEKVCTSITSGWFREWAYENYDLAVADYSGDYMERYRKGLADGVILPFDGVTRHGPG